MIDTSATSNFVANREIQKLGLPLTEHSSCIKAVHFEEKPIQGVASVELRVSTWQGKCSMMFVS